MGYNTFIHEIKFLISSIIKKYTDNKKNVKSLKVNSTEYPV